MIDEKLVCKICGRYCLNYKSITSHVRQSHLLNIKEYYDKYFKIYDEDKCSVCKKQTVYSGFKNGYYKHCSQKCVNNSKERKQFTSLMFKKMWKNPEINKKIKDSVLNQWKTNLSFIQKMTSKDEVFRKKISEFNKKRYLDPKEREKTSDSIKKAYNEKPELREKARQHSLRLWKDPNSSFHKEQYWTNLYNSLTKKGPNHKEIIIQKLLDELFPNVYKYVGDFQFWIGEKNPDFLCYSKKFVIEHFGIWWHGQEVTGQNPTEHEKERIKHYKLHGYDCLVIWENEINNLELLKTKIFNFHTLEKL